MTPVCGIDFGTSNSTVSVADAGGARLIALEGPEVTLPSAIFWEVDDPAPKFGRAAVAAYTEGQEGRLMRGLKSVLGSALITEKTRVGARALGFDEILARFFAALRDRLDAHQPGTRHAVLGRPVHFVDDDAAVDRAAQAVLERIARGLGFDEVAFQFEPIAAALHYEASVTAEELVLIVDIGGGTSDFSVVRVSPERARASDRAGDILGTHGIRVGGTDFDRLFSLSEVMPALGMGTLVHGGKAAMPQHYYLDLATWHRINALYVPQVLGALKALRAGAESPVRIDRLIHVVGGRHGHRVAMAVEAGKIALSQAEAVRLALTPVLGRDIATSRARLDAAVARPVERIAAAMVEVLARAGVAPARVGTVFMTGGSSSLPAVQAAVARVLPQVRVAAGDLLGSVGTGLALDARRRFR